MKNPKAESSAEVYRLRDISKEFRNAEGAVMAKGCDRVSLDIRRGEFLAVTGESGSGKSTLLSLLGFLAVPSPAPAPGAVAAAAPAATGAPPELEAAADAAKAPPACCRATSSCPYIIAPPSSGTSARTSPGR